MNRATPDEPEFARASPGTTALPGRNDSFCRVCSIVTLLTSALFPAIADAQPKADEPAPPLSVERLLNAPDGASAEWGSLKGKVVVVEFWATWCAPCIASIPHLNDLAEQFRDEDVVFISLTDEPADTVEPFLKRRPIKGWVALDTDRQAGQAYGVSGIPHTFVIGRTGKILGDTHPSRLKPEHIASALRGEPLGLEPEATGAAAEGATVPRERKYGRSFMPGRFPAVGTDHDVLPNPLAQVIVRPALSAGGGSSGGSAENRQTWLNIDATSVIKAAYGRAYQVSESRVDLKAALPDQKLDVAIWAPPGDPQAYRRLVEVGIGSAFGLAAHTEQREVDVLLLRAEDAAAQKLTPTASTGGSMSSTRTERDRTITSFINGRLGSVAGVLEYRLRMPVIDQTGLTGGYDFEFVLPDTLEAARETLGSLGLKLEPARRILTYVVIEKVSAE
jgi:uncharacterized protein (TIGR03435 family)